MKNVLQLHKADNVALALSDILPGDTLTITGQSGSSLQARDTVAQMHKIALASLSKGATITKFGQVIGYASRDIQTGQHVHVHNCVVGDVDKDYGFCRNARPADILPETQRDIFQGYRRVNGKTGTRNYIGILTTVNCSATVARQIASHFNADKLKDWPNIDGVVALTHDSGCGMRTGDEGYETMRRTFEGHLRHPNFGAVLLVGLGCETMQFKNVLEESGLANDSETLYAYSIQDAGGTQAAIERGIALIESLLPKVNAYSRVPVPASELILAVQCGGSDAFSAISANPALGVAADTLIRNGGSAIYSETPEIYGAEHLLTQRAITPEVAEKVLERIRWWQDYTQRNGFNLDNNPSPGNKQGGLTTILEKSLGAQSKSGTTALMDAYLYGEPVTTKGLVFMDSPGFDPVSVTGQVASGANIVCFTTGRGSAFGYKPVPSIKLSSNSEVYRTMQDDIDINCGVIVDGEQTLTEVGDTIYKRILAVASGEKTRSEELGYGDAEFNPWKIGAVL